MDPDTKDTVWYVDLDPEDKEDPGVEEIIEADFLVLSTSHYIPGKQRTVRGSLLLTPVQWIFDIVTRDPLDSLEPDMFQVVLPTANIVAIDLSKHISSHHHVQLTVKMDPFSEASCHVCSYGSSQLLPEYSFTFSDKAGASLNTFLREWLSEIFEESSSFQKGDIPQNTEFENSLSLSPLSIVDEPGDIGDTEIESMILSEEDRRELAKSFPGRCVSRYWLLAFSTLHHGFSLKSLYRNCQDHDGPSLLVIQSKDQEIFGAFLSDAPRVSERFYGTGESWLFSCSSGAMKIYNWRGDNNFILRGNLNSLIIGSDHDGFGLWIDEELLHGRSQPVQTFKSPSLTSEKDFHINNLELWTFK